MDFWIYLASLSSVASILGWLLPVGSAHPRWMHAGYGLIIATLTFVSVWHWQQNLRVHNVARAASVLVREFDREYTQAGFVQAALAFLEKNKDLYPDAYARGQKLYAECDCRGTSEIVSLAFELQGLLKGVGTLEGQQE